MDAVVELDDDAMEAYLDVRPCRNPEPWNGSRQILPIRGSVTVPKPRARPEQAARCGGPFCYDVMYREQFGGEGMSPIARAGFLLPACGCAATASLLRQLSVTRATRRPAARTGAVIVPHAL